jgi:hypothetical protein
MSDQEEKTEEKAEEQAAPKRKSKIAKSISRKMQTTTYENVQVFVSFEEEIEWGSLEERTKKSEGITKLLIRDFNKTLSDVWKNIAADGGTNVSVHNAVETSSEQPHSSGNPEDIKQYDGL